MGFKEYCLKGNGDTFKRLLVIGFKEYCLNSFFFFFVMMVGTAKNSVPTLSCMAEFSSTLYDVGLVRTQTRISERILAMVVSGGNKCTVGSLA